jgi:hypothetical protein
VMFGGDSHKSSFLTEQQQILCMGLMLILTPYPRPATS